MANLYRLIAALVFGLLFAPTASAAFPAPASYECTVTGGNGVPIKRSSCQEAAQYIATNYAYPGATAQCSIAYPITSPCGFPGQYGGFNYFGVSYQLVQNCPADSMQGPGGCTCNAGYVEAGGSICVSAPPVNNCKAGASAGRYQYPLSAGRSISTPYFICDGDSPSGNLDGSVCVVRVEGSMATGGFVYGDAFFTGAKKKMGECTGGGGAGNTGDSPTTGNNKPPVEGEPAPTPCKAGEAPGSVNGITKCYPAGSTGQPVTTTDDKETTTTPPAGGASAPTAPNDAGNIGAPQCVGAQCTTNTKSETTCTGDKCTTTATTTTTTTDANGNTTTKTGSTTTTGSKGGFCAENPNSQQCKSGSFGGSCSSAFSCDGDAVMCAIALDQHKRNCTLFETPSPESSLYDSEKNKEGSQATDEAKSIGSGSFDTTDAIGGGSGCITDKAVTVMGKTFMVPFSSVCPSLALIGNVMLFVSFLLAGRIVVRG